MSRIRSLRNKSHEKLPLAPEAEKEAVVQREVRRSHFFGKSPRANDAGRVRRDPLFCELQQWPAWSFNNVPNVLTTATVILHGHLMRSDNTA